MSELLSAPTYTEPDAVVDARGLRCPMPLLQARLECNRMRDGQVLQVVSTDPGTRRDFRAFAEQTGHQLIGEAEEEGVFGFWLQIKRK
ncbi:sulfurtransferase TusA family protein [Pseudomonas mosselii]|uniref:sulfurtransferase TusA family protein n=1 Tax=Pseudomonas mosselii TaxID=78327 RepID=UPI0021DB424D|nr:sulfurtransferase TusA family protein [Pseudomonas mosselii]MCU9529316.1 sulfurtransferase TusA family protein [Pseudomonas mosselii]MCU9536607.1 sulfurtransferase TusA family protein [Pseudomonas mosselii]MCU9542227.1 sulfurtransferase TusA family protein [Pseudomonas mosselii]MCU9548332.1 sulfurtransferase TusA family protein [Pseudomonas mosselii]